jgi:hypothetical protein
MPLSKRTAKKFKNFDLSVSFKMGETRDRLRDSLNVFSNQGRLETRFGRSRYNAVSLGGSVLSMTFFENTNNEVFLLAKVGGTIYSVSKTGAHLVIKTGLSANTKHRGVTWGRGSTSRHIISIEEDGLFQFDGVSFSPLGQEPPAAPTIIVTSGSIATGNYQVGLTFYSSKTGFETNLGILSGIVNSDNTKAFELSAIPATALNASIDKVRIYLKNTIALSEALYVGEVALGVTTYDITETPTSTLIPPLANSMPLDGGGKFITAFNRCLVYAGNTNFKNDVYFSEPDLPDAFNDGTEDGRLVLYATLDGAISGLATGLYNNSVLDPFLVVFKKRSTHIYSEIGGQSRFIPISSEIGCVSHSTITVKNGAIYFLSEQGWRAIVNGAFVTDNQSNPITLANGDIDDIFRSPGYAYEANQVLLENCFSVYYSALDQYMTWMAEGANAEFTKTYVYEYRVGGFKPYEFNTPSTCACIGQEAAHEVVYMADAEGYIYRHSTNQDRADEDSTGTQRTIKAYGILTWLDGEDLDKSFNFRELILRRLAGAGDLTVRVSLGYDLDSSDSILYENALSGFVLDVAKLDIDAFGSSERSIITARADINRTGENILIGFYQEQIGQNVALVAAQVEFTANGNRN